MLPGIRGLAGRVGGASYGPELIVNGDFSSGTGWGLNGDAAPPQITGGQLRFPGGGDGSEITYVTRPAITLVAGAKYLVSFDCISTGSADFTVHTPNRGDSAFGGMNLSKGAGSYSGVFTAASTSFAPNINDNYTGASAVFDNLSLRQVL